MAYISISKKLGLASRSASFTAPAGASRWHLSVLKSIIGLSGPPGEDPQVAKTWIMAHLLMILLLEPHASAPELSPRMAA
jgi:hypothetical protein